MKIHIKNTILIVGVFLVFIIIFLGYEYVRFREDAIYRESKRSRDEEIIDKVIELKKASFIQPTRDNGNWDEMVDFVKNRDSVWAKLNFTTILKTYELSSMMVYDKVGDLIYSEVETGHSEISFSPEEVRKLFSSSPVVHSYCKFNDQLFEIYGATIVPVTDTDRTTEAQGYLVTVNLWDDHYVYDLQAATGFKMFVNNLPVSNSSNTGSNDSIYRTLTDFNNNEVAQITFYREDKVNAELKYLQILIFAGLLFFVLIIFIISFMTRKWLTIPLRKISRGLSKGNTKELAEMTNLKNEFGDIAKLIIEYNDQKTALINEISERENAQRAMTEAKDFAEMIYKVTPSAIFTVDSEKIITSWNKKAELISGYTAEEMIGNSCRMFAESPCNLGCGLYNTEIKKPISGKECKIRHKSGKDINILKNVDLLTDAQGGIIGGVESFEDITERKLMEKSLAESEKKFRTLYDGSGDAIMLLNEKGFFDCNPKTLEVFGLNKVEEFTAFHPAELSPPLQPDGKNSFEKAGEHIGAAFKNGNERFEWMHRRANGQDFPAEVLLSAIDYNGNRVIQATVRDITERKKIESELQERELKLNTITASAQDAIIMIDNNGKIEFWNRAACNIFGYNEQEALGKDLHELLTPERYKSACRPAFANFKTSGEGNAIGKTVELAAIRKDGREIDIELSMSAIKLNDLWGAVGIVRDISERKLFELNLLKAKEEAERANNAKSEFLAMMSHEIRTPMNGIIGMTELTLTTKLTPTQREYLEASHNSAFLLLDTINSILDFSKIEAGKLEIENTVFNLREMVERCVEILNLKAFQKKIELLFEIEPSLPELFIGDAIRIRQILINLIGNAIKFTEQGEICVAVKMNGPVPEAGDEINVLFSVRDTGIGIPKDKISKIFSSFEQADNSTTRKYGGTGLGLSISKSLTELMTGKIWVESKTDVGSTFAFEIPLVVSEEPEEQASDSVDVIKKVLVIDDNATNLKIMHDMLEYWGIKVTVSSNGLEGLDIMHKAKESQDPFDLVILDMHMPGMDGISVAEKIKQSKHLDIDPVILMFSSIEKDSLKEMSRNAGIDRYLTKPVKMQELRELLSGLKKNTGEDKKAEEPVMKKLAETYSGKRILVAEDNITNMKLMNALLSKTGVEILNACNGSEAVDIFNKHTFDLVFMDVHMPVMDGFEATRIIRSAEKEGKRTPIVALTAIAMQGDRERCLENGMDDYLSKPFTNADLKSMLRKYLSSGSGIDVVIEGGVQEIQDNSMIFNRKDFMQLVGNNEELFLELLDHYKSAMPEMITKLMNSVVETDYRQIQYFSHTIKGMSGNVRALRIRNLAEKIEKLAEIDGNIEKVKPLSERMEIEFMNFLEFLKKISKHDS